MADSTKKTVRGTRSRSSNFPPSGSATRRTGTIQDFIGCLAGKTKKVATIEEINQAAEDGWAGKVRMHKNEK